MQDQPVSQEDKWEMKFLTMTSNFYHIKTLFYCRAINKSWVTAEPCRNCRLSLAMRLKLTLYMGILLTQGYKRPYSLAEPLPCVDDLFLAQ